MFVLYKVHMGLTSSKMVVSSGVFSVGVRISVWAVSKDPGHLIVCYYCTYLKL